MVNNTKFANRLQQIIDYYNENASSFAQKIGVQRSSISHILSGRNKPSLDFILKINSSYPAINLYWLLTGTGTFLKADDTASYLESHSENDKSATPLFTSADEKLITNSKNTSTSNAPKPKTIARIVLLYSDGTFSSYTN